MNRRFLLTLFAAMPGLALAQPPKNLELTEVKLTLRPAASPNPPILYELLPNSRSRTPGNAVLMYYRALLMMGENASSASGPKERQERARKFNEMLEKPVDDALLRSMSEYLESQRLAIRELEAGARCSACDWRREERVNADSIAVMLPEVQKMRELAHLLNIRCRMHIGRRQAAKALGDVQIGFALARHVGEGNNLIQSLVGVAIFHIFAKRLEEILELPDCPNLYWSLTALPRALFDVRRPLEFEIRSLEASLPAWEEIDKPMSAEQARAALDKCFSSIQQLSGAVDVGPATSPLALAGLVATRLPGAKQRLRQLGRTEAELDAMPAAQIILLESVIHFRSIRDELTVWFSAPYLEAAQGLKQVEEKVRKLSAQPVDVHSTLLGLLVPAANKARSASVRTERRIALLRTIEALRLYAAANEGKFPTKLSDLNLTPVPADPATSKPFEYELTKEGKALLTAPTPQGEKANPGNTLKYELTLKR